jgi:protease I
MLDGKRIAILVEDDFEGNELIEPLRAMKDAGARVVLVGSGSRESYQSKRGNLGVSVDTAADRVKAGDFDAIIIPGGYAPDKMRLHRSMIDLVRQAHDLGKVIAAICHGPASVTVDLENAGAIWVDEAVVHDDNLITSRKPADLPKFNKVIIEALSAQGAL